MKYKQLGNGGGLDFTKTNASFLIEMSEDNYLLFDCGFNIMQELIKLDKNPSDSFLLANLNKVFISHTHEDHMGNLAGLMYHRFFILNKTTDIICGKKVKPYVEEMLKTHCNQSLEACNVVTTPMYNMIEGTYKVEPILGNHMVLPSYGLLLLNNFGKNLFISGDTKAYPEIERVLTARPSSIVHNTIIFHDFSHWNTPSRNIHMCQSDMEAEYSKEFISHLKFYHTGEDFNNNWIEL